MVNQWWTKFTESSINGGLTQSHGSGHQWWTNTETWKWVNQWWTNTESWDAGQSMAGLTQSHVVEWSINDMDNQWWTQSHVIGQSVVD